MYQPEIPKNANWLLCRDIGWMWPNQALSLSYSNHNCKTAIRKRCWYSQCQLPTSQFPKIELSWHWTFRFLISFLSRYQFSNDLFPHPFHFVDLKLPVSWMASSSVYLFGFSLVEWLLLHSILRICIILWLERCSFVSTFQKQILTSNNDLKRYSNEREYCRRHVLLIIGLVAQFYQNVNVII